MFEYSLNFRTQRLLTYIQIRSYLHYHNYFYLERISELNFTIGQRFNLPKIKTTLFDNTVVVFKINRKKIKTGIEPRVN